MQNLDEFDFIRFHNNLNKILDITENKIGGAKKEPQNMALEFANLLNLKIENVNDKKKNKKKKYKI